ncbi:putative G-protein coupled receptor 132b [Sphaeramia orbicularis]|uniref:Probable G-protein coupled receptor 132 n=1 Tax=Sphaeramia orbicularis TaxID=375764 RepID=A0A673AF48_9TELE|nr:probable G-protein coupled receptor 132 [Sphaeramia orbicularis]
MMHQLSVTETVPVSNDSLVQCEVPYDAGRLPLVVLYSAVLVVGLPSNLLTLYLTWLQVWRGNVLSVYLWSLSLCDLTYLGTLPLWATYVNRHHEWPWSSLACKVTGYIFFNNMYVSIFLLVMVSIDRYVAVVYCVESRGLRRQRHAVAVSLGIVLLVALGHLPVFSMREGDAATGDRRCFEPSRSSSVVTGFSYTRVVVGFLIPLLLLIVTNHRILSSVQLSTGLRRKQKDHVRRLAVAVVVLFLVCFAPYHLILLIRAMLSHFPRLDSNTCLFERKLYTPYTISLGLSTINSAVNPILYVLSSDNIRKELSRGLMQLCSCRRNQNLRTQTDSSQNQKDATKNSSEESKITKTTNSPAQRLPEEATGL